MSNSYRTRHKSLRVAVALLLVSACSDGVLQQPSAETSTRFASVTIETPSDRGGVFQIARDVRWIDARAQDATPVAVTDSVAQAVVRARPTHEAPIGSSRRVTRAPDGTTVELQLLRTVAGAPISRVEARSGAKLMFVVQSEWIRKDDNFVLASRYYERHDNAGNVVRSSVAFREGAANGIRSTWEPAHRSSSFIGNAISAGVQSYPSPVLTSMAAEECETGGGGGGGDMRAGMQSYFTEEECGGCGLKFLAMTAAAAAATVLAGAGAYGFLATFASGGILAPAEAAILAAWFTAEGVFLDRLDNWLECINSEA